MKPVIQNLKFRKNLDRATFDKIIKERFPTWDKEPKEDLDMLYKSFVELIKVLNEK